MLLGGTHVTPNAPPVVLTEAMLGTPGGLAQMLLAPLGSWTAQPRPAQQSKGGGGSSKERRRVGKHAPRYGVQAGGGGGGKVGLGLGGRGEGSLGLGGRGDGEGGRGEGGRGIRGLGGRGEGGLGLGGRGEGGLGLCGGGDGGVVEGGLGAGSFGEGGGDGLHSWEYGKATDEHSHTQIPALLRLWHTHGTSLCAGNTCTPTHLLGAVKVTGALGGPSPSTFEA